MDAVLRNMTDAELNAIAKTHRSKEPPMHDVQITSSAEVMTQASMTANDYMLDAKGHDRCRVRH
jgi:hypothetical protein